MLLPELSAVSFELKFNITIIQKKKKKHVLHITDRMSRRNVIKCCVFVTDLLNFVTCANTK